MTPIPSKMAPTGSLFFLRRLLPSSVPQPGHFNLARLGQLGEMAGTAIPTDKTPSWRNQPTSHSYSKSYHQQSWQDKKQYPHRPAARLSAAPHSDSRPLIAYSSAYKRHVKASQRHPRSDTGYNSRGSSTIPEDHIQVSLKDDHKQEWTKSVKFGLNHKHRMKATSELTDAEKPQPCLTIDHDQFHQAYKAIRSINRRIPSETAKLATHLISGSRLIDDIELPARTESHQHAGLSVPSSIHLQILTA